MRRIRVLHFIWRLEVGGGIPNVQRQILKWTDRQRFELHVCSVRPLFDEDCLGEIGDDVTFHSLDIQGKAGLRARGKIMLGLARVLRKVRPDVSHAYAGYAWLAIIPDFISQRATARILDIQSDPSDGLLSWRNVSSQRFMVRQMGYHPVVHSRSTRDHVAEAFAVSSESIILFPNGIETASFACPKTSRQEWRRLYGIAPDALVVLNAARLVPGKNVGLYVEVARRVLGRVGEAVFLVAGGGPLKNKLESSVRDYGLQDKIRFVGFIDHLADAYHASDIFLSTSDAESFPLTILEAMATGKPVVATSAGGVVEQVVDRGTGRLCPVGDADALTEAIVELLQNEAWRIQWGAAAQERARRLFDVHTMVRRYEELYMRMVEGETREVARTHV